MCCGGGVANAKPKYPPDVSGGYNKQEGQKCHNRWVAQAAIRLATAVIKFRKRKEMLGYPV